MIRQLSDAAQRHGFSDYIVRRIHSREHQIYLLRDRVESRRFVESECYDATLYLDHEEGGQRYRGSYAFTLKPGEDVERALEQAALGARVVHNRPYGITVPRSFPDVAIYDSRIREADHLGDELADEIQGGWRGKSVELSSAEIHLRDTTIEIVSSRGFRGEKRGSRFDVEFTIISHGQRGDDAELSHFLQRRHHQHLDLRRHLGECRRRVKDMLRVRTPRQQNTTVLFPADQLHTLFGPVIYHASAHAKDSGLSVFEKGMPLAQEVHGDRLTLRSSALVPFGNRSEPFDDEGIPAQEVTVIKDGVFSDYWATQQYADYLSVPATGSFKNLIIETDRPSPAILPSHYLEIVQFSSLAPDPLTGDFVAEIRLGYEHANGRRRPVKGGSVSGNILKAMADIHCLGPNEFVGDYLGPAAIAIADLTVAGK